MVKEVGLILIEEVILGMDYRFLTYKKIGKSSVI